MEATKATMCANLQTLANYNSDSAINAYASGNSTKGASLSKAADENYGMAKLEGCAWAG